MFMKFKTHLAVKSDLLLDHLAKKMPSLEGPLYDMRRSGILRALDAGTFRSLGRLKDRAERSGMSLAGVARFTWHETGDIRTNALIVLKGAIKDTPPESISRISQKLASAFSSGNAEVRYDVITALGYMMEIRQDEAAGSAMLEALADKDAMVRYRTKVAFLRVAESGTDISRLFPDMLPLLSHSNIEIGASVAGIMQKIIQKSGSQERRMLAERILISIKRPDFVGNADGNSAAFCMAANAFAGLMAAMKESGAANE